MAEITLEEGKKILAKIVAEARPKYSTAELVKRGEKRYKQIKEHLEPKHKNKFVVIEVDSGDYFIDKDSVKATLKARKNIRIRFFIWRELVIQRLSQLKGTFPYYDSWFRRSASTSQGTGFYS